MTARPMTVGEFLEWDGGKNPRWELHDGVPVAMASSTRDQGALQAVDPARPRQWHALFGHNAAWDNIWSYATIPSVRDIIVFSTTEVRAQRGQRIRTASRTRNCFI